MAKGFCQSILPIKTCFLCRAIIHVGQWGENHHHQSCLCRFLHRRRGPDARQGESTQVATPGRPINSKTKGRSKSIPKGCNPPVSLCLIQNIQSFGWYALALNQVAYFPAVSCVSGTSAAWSYPITLISVLYAKSRNFSLGFGVTRLTRGTTAMGTSRA